MKKYYYLLCFTLAILMFPCVRLSAQNDNEIIKEAEKNLTEKDCKSAFELVVTVKHFKNKKAQAILKKAYPCVISDNLEEANKIKINDSTEILLLCLQLRELVSYLKDNEKTDSLFKERVPESTYKTYSKVKKNEKILAGYEEKLAKEEKKAFDMGKALVENPKPENNTKIKEPEKPAIVVVDVVVDTNKARTNGVIWNSKPLYRQTENTPVLNVNTTDAKNVTTVLPPSSNKFFIIQGSYKTAEEATAAVNKLKAAGYAAEIVGLNQFGNTRVSYNSYSSRADAEKQLEVIRKVQQDAWILEK